VVLVDDAAIAALNRTYRRVGGPTDVLAFPMTEGAAELTPTPGRCRHLGRDRRPTSALG
jgi:ssRNA-specific RNase YbeY (16S rRNA maturation enzyme)